MDQRSQQLQQNRKVFFGEQNERALYTALSNNISQNLGSRLTEAQTLRLERGLEFYMSEVFQANNSLNVQALNREVYSATMSDFNEYIQREDSLKKATPQVFQEASQRFDQIQQERQRSLELPRPSAPEYIQPIIIKEDDSVAALTLFEEAKKRRNQEMSSQADEQNQRRTNAAMKPVFLQDERELADPRQLYLTPTDLVASGRADVNPTIASPDSSAPARNILQQDIIIKRETNQSYREHEHNLCIYSADRNWEFVSNIEHNRYNFTTNIFSINSPVGVNVMPKAANRIKNIIRIEFVKAVIPIEATDIVIRKVNSTNSPNYVQALVNAQAVAITSVNAGVSVASPPAANLAQLNLSKLIEYNNLIGSPAIYGDQKYDSTYTTNVYSFPFVTINVEELDTNTFGTSNSVDNAFGILQCDSNWTDNTESLGFTSLIPKHMKCQRIFSPTPLSTLNKMTIRLQRPNGQLLNTWSDTLDINGIFLSHYDSIRAYFSGDIDLSGTAYSDDVGEYIWIDCKQWFNRFQFNVGDRIQIKNLTSAQPTPAVTDLINFLQTTDGLLVVGTAFKRTITASVKTFTGITTNQITNGISNTAVQYVLDDGCNTAGYSQYLIVRGKFNDPRSGAITILPYGNAADNSSVSTAIISGVTKIIPGRLINLSKQAQYIFRVITREYDSSNLVRPDNL
jgi:hypothetical protein